ncbi:avidin-like [Hypanus sabinus]|uniref:avidin-like n=1 Tax=Hypanus sabinus TaxID=79690 RepID=UPI0028C37CCF|nr:avidin-like [Hypanus sabinus]
MLRKLPQLTLLLALGIVGASCFTVQSLAGCWTNELGSTADIVMDEDGTLRGTYKSAVSRTGSQVEGVLIGFQVNVAQPTFGFVVKWTTDSVLGAVSVWTGEIFGDQMKTVWLERSPTTLKNNWAATLTGSDIFTRCK